MDTNYTEEKFIQAVRALAVGKDAIKGRLVEAHRYFAVLSESDFPNSLKPDFRWIMESLTTRPPLRDRFTRRIISGTVAQTLHFMRSRKATGIAERIVALRDRLREHNGEK